MPATKGNIEKNRKKRLKDMLTKRERQVLIAACGDMSNAEIAKLFSVSVKSIEKNKTELYKKTKARGLAGLYRFALIHGYIRPKFLLIGNSIQKKFRLSDTEFDALRIICTGKNNKQTANIASHYVTRATIKQKMNDLDGAIEDFNKAIQLNPTETKYYLSRGNAKFGQAKYNDALIDFNKAVELKADNANAINNRGTCKFKMGDKVGACQDWNKAFSLGIKGTGAWIEKYCN